MAEWKATDCAAAEARAGHGCRARPQPTTQGGGAAISQRRGQRWPVPAILEGAARAAPLRGRWTMANGKLLKQLIRSGAEGDLGAFRGVARRMIDEERQKQHHLLANDLEIILDGRSRSCAPTVSSPPSSARPPPTCAGSAGHDLRR